MSFIVNIRCDNRNSVRFQKGPDLDLEELHQHIKEERQYQQYVQSGGKIYENN